MDSQCLIKGNDNLYGLGIRIGLYSNGLASYIANNLVQGEASTIRAMNTTFHLALLIALLSERLNLQSIDAYILLVLNFGDNTFLSIIFFVSSSWKSRAIFVCPKANFYYESVTLAGLLLRLTSTIAF